MEEKTNFLNFNFRKEYYNILNYVLNSKIKSDAFKISLHLQVRPETAQFGRGCNSLSHPK